MLLNGIDAHIADFNFMNNYIRSGILLQIFQWIWCVFQEAYAHRLWSSCLHFPHLVLQTNICSCVVSTFAASWSYWETKWAHVVCWILFYTIYFGWSHPYKKIGRYVLQLLMISEALLNLWKAWEVNCLKVLFLLFLLPAFNLGFALFFH